MLLKAAIQHHGLVRANDCLHVNQWIQTICVSILYRCSSFDVGLLMALLSLWLFNKHLLTLIHLKRCASYRKAAYRLNKVFVFLNAF